MDPDCTRHDMVRSDKQWWVVTARSQGSGYPNWWALIIHLTDWLFGFDVIDLSLRARTTDVHLSRPVLLVAGAVQKGQCMG